jgi:phosphoglycerate dehydrogenase-like enzyme
VRRAVVDLNSPRPVWSVPDATLDAVRRAFGRGWEVVRVAAAASSDGDGGAGNAEAVRAALGAEVYAGWGVPRAVVAAASGTLRWVHTAAAGVGASITPELRASGAQLTNSAGVHAEPIADWVVTAIGCWLRGVPAALRAQGEGRWAKDAFTDGSVPLREFAGTRVGIVGMGGIGRAVARRCAALGMSVSAIRRRRGGRRPAGVRWVGGPGTLRALARRSDVLVLAAPQTAETTGLVGAAILAALPHGAYLVNVARGALLDEEALRRALDDGHVAGCALDVFRHEPLAPDHAFWRHPRVVVFPHASAVSDRFWSRETALLVDNIARYRRGRRLRNVVNLEQGY